MIIRGEKRSFDLQTWLESLPDETFEIAAITVAELWHGVERASPNQRAPRERYLQAMLSVLPVIPYGQQTAYIHARLWAKLQSTGKMIGYYDLLVAATALERNCEVATFNKRHFHMAPGLKIIQPE